MATRYLYSYVQFMKQADVEVSKGVLQSRVEQLLYTKEGYENAEVETGGWEQLCRRVGCAKTVDIGWRFYV